MKIPRNVLATVLLVTFSGPIWGQVVQLPTRRSFAVGTTVSVPDQGQTLLGGVTRARSASVDRSVPVLGRLPGLDGMRQNRAFSRSIGTGQAHIRATIIDLNAMDHAILAQTPVSDTGETKTAWIKQKAEFLSRHVDRYVLPSQLQIPHAADRRPGDGNADAKGRPAPWAGQHHQNEALDYLSRGQSALERGKDGAARVYLRMAARRAEGPLRDRVLAALDNISPPKSGREKVSGTFSGKGS